MESSGTRSDVVVAVASTNIETGVSVKVGSGVKASVAVSSARGDSAVIVAIVVAVTVGVEGISVGSNTSVGAGRDSEGVPEMVPFVGEISAITDPLSISVVSLRNKLEDINPTTIITKAINARTIIDRF